jgi:hypothetical protein
VQLLGGALSVLKRVLRYELRDITPDAELPARPRNKKSAEAEPAQSQKRPATAPKEAKAAQADLLDTVTLAAAGAAAGVAATATTEEVDEKPTKKAAGKPAEKVAEKSAAKATKSTQPPGALKRLPQAGNQKKKKGLASFIVNTIDANEIDLTPIDKPQPPVPSLAHGLDRVLFNPGVYHIQDPRSHVFNFDPYLTRIMPVKDFDYNAIKQYVTSSKDTTLIQTAAENNKKYTGSTSSMTSSLAHFHFLLSSWRPINPSMMSKEFEVDSHRFTRIMRAPSATFLHWKDGTYAIDADKEFDTANVLSMLGKSMEKFLTLPKEEFEKYRRTKSDQLTDEERNGPESYHYTTLGDFLMRSQLDAYDPRLPGTGMFDLKTRAVISIRMDARDIKKGIGYEIRNRFGNWESFEREYYDMIRSAFLKYSLQVRMGRMDGIFVAFHNTERVFGFQYIPLEEMDLSLHGQTDVTLGDREFKLSVFLLNKVLNKLTEKYPGRTLRVHFETRGEDSTPFLYVFAKPVTPEQVERVQGATRAKVEEFEREMMGLISEKESAALEEEDGGEEGVDEVDEHDVQEGGGDEVASSAAWEDVMLKVEDELENEERGVTFVREAIEDALQESGLLRTTPPEETQRYVDAFLDALTGNDQRAASEDQESLDIIDEDAEPTEVEQSEKSESSVESSESTTETDATPSTAPEETENVQESSEGTSSEGPLDEEPLATEDAPAEQPTLKDMIIKLANEIRAIPSEQRAEDRDIIEEDAPEYTQRLRKIEKILSELTEEGQDKESDGTGVVETGSVSVEAGEAVETVEQSEKSDEQVAEGGEPFTTPSSPDTPTPTESATKNYTDEAIDKDGELCGLILTLRNKVDGKYIDRPKDLQPNQSWTVEYAMEEIKPDRARMLYRMVLKRRKDLLYPDTAVPPPERDRWYYLFKGRLEHYSKRGRRFRRFEDSKQRFRPVHVFGAQEPYTYESVFEEAKEDGSKPYEVWPGEPKSKVEKGEKEE